MSMKQNSTPLIVIGSAQENAFVGSVRGMGGGQIPMIVYAYEQE